MTEEKKNFIIAMRIYLKSINAPQNQWLNYSCHVQLGDDSIKQTSECLTVGIPGVPFNKWISMKNRFPEKEGRYLAFDKTFGIKTEYWRHDNEWQDDNYDFITHWQYLPEAPNE